MKTNTCNHLHVSLLTQFKHQAQRHIRSIWADLLELEEAPDGPALSDAREQTQRRIRTLEWAARAAEAREVLIISQTLEDEVTAISHGRDESRPESFETLHETMTKLAEALYQIDATASADEQVCYETHDTLVESCAD